MSSALIGDRIEGTRVTVHDVYYYQVNGRTPQEIADILQITPEQVEAARRYITDREEKVSAVHRRIEARNARGNSPEVEALRKGARERMQAWLLERRRDQERNGEGAPHDSHTLHVASRRK